MGHESERFRRRCLDDLRHIDLQSFAQQSHLVGEADIDEAECVLHQFGQLFRLGLIHIQTAFLIADAINQPATFFCASASENTEFPRAKSNLAEFLRRVVQIPCMILLAAPALDRVLVEQCLGPFDPRQGQVACLDSVAVILPDDQMQPAGVKDTNDN